MDLILKLGIYLQKMEKATCILLKEKNIIIKSGINISAKEIDEPLLNSKLVKDTFTTSIEDVFHGENQYLILYQKNLIKYY